MLLLEGLTCASAAALDRLALRIWVEASDAVRLRRGLDRDGQDHRLLWIDSMLTQRLFFTKDATGTRAELRVNANPSTSHDRESEVGPLDQVASESASADPGQGQPPSTTSFSPRSIISQLPLARCACSWLAFLS